MDRVTSSGKDLRGLNLALGLRAAPNADRRSVIFNRVDARWVYGAQYRGKFTRGDTSTTSAPGQKPETGSSSRQKPDRKPTPSKPFPQKPNTLKDSPVWNKVPNRLILISCYTADLWGTNIIITADQTPTP